MNTGASSYLNSSDARTHSVQDLQIDCRLSGSKVLKLLAGIAYRIDKGLRRTSTNCSVAYWQLDVAFAHPLIGANFDHNRVPDYFIDRCACSRHRCGLHRF